MFQNGQTHFKNLVANILKIEDEFIIDFEHFFAYLILDQP